MQEFRGQLTTVLNAIDRREKIRIRAINPEDNTIVSFILRPFQLEDGYVQGFEENGYLVRLHWDYWNSVERFPLGR